MQPEARKAVSETLRPAGLPACLHGQTETACLALTGLARLGRKRLHPTRACPSVRLPARRRQQSALSHGRRRSSTGTDRHVYRSSNPTQI